jgi:hypothetical protein
VETTSLCNSAAFARSKYRLIGCARRPYNAVANEEKFAQAKRSSAGGESPRSTVSEKFIADASIPAVYRIQQLSIVESWLACFACSMKDRPLIYLSLALSIAALAYAVWVHQHAEQMATDALHKRELEFVIRYTPKMREVYSGMTGHTNVYPSDPKTIEELFRPMAEMMNRLGGTEEKETLK